MKKFVILFLILIISFVAASSLENKTLGDDDATVKIVIYTDFQDPYSAKWYNETLPKIKENYINNEEVKILWKHFPLNIYKNSHSTAVASECVAEQDYFFKYIDIIYNNQNDLNDQELRQYAEELNLDMKKFDKCIIDNDARDTIESDIKDGKNFDIKGVPTFVINNKYVIAGAQKFDVFEEQINKILSVDDDSVEPNIKIPKNCVSWYDGCNNCSIENGELLACTEKACEIYDKPYCKTYKYEEPVDSNSDIKTTIIDSNTEISVGTPVEQKCFGCNVNDTCYPAGYRTGSEFCNIETGKLEEQKTNETVCSNDFECSTNVCISGKCVSKGIIEAIFEFFANFFGIS